MSIKKIFAFILCLSVIFTLTACKSNKEENLSQENTAVSETEETYENENPTEKVLSDDETVSFVDGVTETSEAVSVEESSGEEAVNAEPVDDPAIWTVERIVEEYKTAAKKTHPHVKSQHKIVLKSISVNNGEHAGLFDFITSVMGKLLANNSEDKNGITGGYNNLIAADVKTAKAYKVGKNTVIEMVMREQTSGAREDANSGSVGHAITAVGDISEVTKQIADLGIPLDIPDSSTKIHYTNPTVKVVIGPDGKIINGTWQYTVEIKLTDYKAFGKPVNTTSVIMDNILSVNGGFKK